MKILMMGNRESGKTTYMASAFGLLENGQNGFYIRTDDGSARWFQTLFRSIQSGGYPSATDKRGSYHFGLFYYQKKVLDFEWIDYNGGVITELDAEKLYADIDTAEGIILFLEASALLTRSEKVTRFRRILSLIAQKLSKTEEFFTVILVITKYDELPANVPFSQVQEPLMEFLHSAEANDLLYARVVPVSCTKSGFYNVEVPLLDMLDSGMKVEYRRVAEEANRLAHKSQEMAGKAGFFDWMISRLIDEPTYGDLAEKYLKEAKEKLELFQSIEGPMEKLSEHVGSIEVVCPPRSAPAQGALANRQNSRRLLEL